MSKAAFGDLGASDYSDFDFAAFAAAAPDPATWSMMMIGFGRFAAASWRKARRQRI
jgi:PEP-CTERM motif